MDAGYGNKAGLRAAVTAVELSYIAGILSNATVWAPGTGLLPPKPWSGRGRPPKRLRRGSEHEPVAVEELALALPEQAGLA